MIFVVIPAYNEEKNIGRVVRGLIQYGYANIVVIDDGSCDKTGEEARIAGAVVLHHTINRGQGAALQTGDDYILLRGASVAVHFDADGQFDAADIAPAIKLLQEKQLDVVLGSRFLDNRSRIPFFKKFVVFPVGRLINFFLTGLKLSDVHNGFRILSRHALEQIHITQDGMAHNSEIIAQIKKKNLKFAEQPVLVYYYEYGQGIGGGLKILRDWILAKLIK
ncbi:MAG: glycosyltransferase family 2 protein [Candidatus Magasanikbacteria bacterium CG10_big_fil_rev_8_21_14_0_10_36_32]|uniref:Glycosyltransferase family 2 protein n=1 Tax=Candidatus Magasanikbacteria bacterium CG10_big_fil_rev_8_21_14_0_10_36_32 TaxID=1974646 RepID=A0A2M6W626_9BACT|nr:MAG: glycosyltransferase family 2 protein [Candidatus Magasanikbacteria bacterium CG10_big_fil_rev_8_21_14_0_10_36_32]